jgi:hypothetical protein
MIQTTKPTSDARAKTPPSEFAATIKKTPARPEAIKTPGTPRRKKRKADVGSPPRMANGCLQHDCDHSDLALICVEAGYFTERLLQTDNYPNKCVGDKCNKLFTNKRKGLDLSTYCKVTPYAPARVCRNSMNHRDHQCVFALCHGCFNQKIATSPVKRARKMRGLGSGDIGAGS